ncbi:transmembrane protein, partial [Cystoisospora suis]
EEEEERSPCSSSPFCTFGERGRRRERESKRRDHRNFSSSSFSSRDFSQLSSSSYSSSQSSSFSYGDLLLACLLTVGGGIFGFTSCYVYKTAETRRGGLLDAMPYALLSFFCLCPGVYHIVLFILILLRIPGLTYRGE